MNIQNTPTILIVFGATGDLMSRKIVPALFHLYEDRQLPEKFSVVGFARRPLGQDGFHSHIAEVLQKHLNEEEKQQAHEFHNLFRYHQGEFQTSGEYKTLNEHLQSIDSKWGLCSNKLFYLAVPPEHYEDILRNLHDSGLTKPCGGDLGWTRVLIEKPFGKDLKTAEELDSLLASLFKPEQIYPIDHYLAKEMLQNILAFRFSNSIFEQVWNNQFIERIDIRLWETKGVEDRGAFYDGLGALRDVGQNHLLQMLALATMEHPINWQAETIRAKRAELLQSLKLSSLKDGNFGGFRAQYEGYKAIKNVAPDSATETYFKIKAFIDSPRWQGVPVFMESGKRMSEQRKEIVVTFKQAVPFLHPSDEGSLQYKKEGNLLSLSVSRLKNKVIFSIEPKEEILVKFLTKKPGTSLKIEERDFGFTYRAAAKKSQYVEEYQKLLLDCIVGDQTLFVSTEEVKAMWRFIDPIVKAWAENKVPLQTYRPGSVGVVEAATVAMEQSIVSAGGFKKELAVIGLGKMGANIARHLAEKGWQVFGWNRTFETVQTLASEGIAVAERVKEAIAKLSKPRIVWLMLPASVKASEGESAGPIDEMLKVIVPLLERGDIVIDGGNSFYKDSVRRYSELKAKGIHFIDVGFSGGPSGARHGGSLMVGGDREVFKQIEPLFSDLARPGGLQFFNGPGAGHFVKMVHNGIEYGMMQAIAEGFTILKQSDYNLDLAKVADIYNHGSVIESRLTDWLQKAFVLHGAELKDVSSTVAHTGEGAWTVQTAQEMGLEAKIIEGALQFRILSEKNPSYTGKILSALREQFGGHKVT